METLYRKYRPLDFDSVVGQDPIVKTLKNQIVSGNVSHAYLFSGTRGTGKTTVAKIFARAVNCPNEIDGNPCNECDVCKASIEGADYNILELDAASNGNVDKVRQITESMQYAPINDEKYKVYIIDEAHALTGYSKEAFLKSLEEPPEYVIYILATTDPNKLPETILSRCQKYSFKRISIETIVAYLKKICNLEKIEIEDDALYFIAEKSDGSMREAISMLDRCRSYTKDTLTKEKIIDILGLVSNDEFTKLLKAVNEGKVSEALDIVGESIDKGKDINQFTSDFIWHIRNVLIAGNLSKPIEALNITKDSFDKYKSQASIISKETLIYFIEELSRVLSVMRYDENRRVILETALIRLANPETNFLESAVMARLKELENVKASGTYVKMVDEVTEKKNDEISEISLSKLTYDEINLVIDNWDTIKASVSPTAKSVLSKADLVPGNAKEPGFIQVLMPNGAYELLQGMGKKEGKEADEDNIKLIEETLSKTTASVIKKDVIYKIVDKSKTKYAEKITFRIEDHHDKIEGMPIGVEDD